MKIGSVKMLADEGKIFVLTKRGYEKTPDDVKKKEASENH